MDKFMIGVLIAIPGSLIGFWVVAILGTMITDDASNVVTWAFVSSILTMAIGVVIAIVND